MRNPTVNVALTTDEAYAVRAAIQAFIERERELPPGDPHLNPTWRLERMVQALCASLALEDALTELLRRT